jgi:putative lipoic acid-binding regulatory protein
MDKLTLSYPCQWDYTVIGVDEALLRDAIAEVFRGKDYSVVVSKKSKTEKYISLIVTAQALSEEDRAQQFSVLGRHPAITMVL